MLSISDAIAIVTLISGLLLVGVGRRKGKQEAEARFSYETADPVTAQWRETTVAHQLKMIGLQQQICADTKALREFLLRDPKLMDRIEADIRDLANEGRRR